MPPTVIPDDVAENYRQIHEETGQSWETLASNNQDPNVAAWMRGEAEKSGETRDGKQPPKGRGGKSSQQTTADANTVTDEEALAELAKAYEKPTAADLKKEVASRNEQRSPDQQIVVEKPGQKKQLVAALAADDLATAGDPSDAHGVNADGSVLVEV